MSKPKPIPFLTAQQQTQDLINSILTQMKQPMNQNPDTQKKFIDDLTKVLKEILEVTQNTLMLNATGYPNGVKADVCGWTTASTDFDNPAVIKDLPHAKIVNKILRDLLNQQEKEAAEKGAPISQAQILAAQQAADDINKTAIELESLPDPELNGARSKLVIDKTNGDTQMYVQDTETGIWSKVGNTMVGFWKNVKEFSKNIWNWFAKQFTRFKEWICGLFKSPEEQDVIYEQVTQ